MSEGACYATCTISIRAAIFYCRTVGRPDMAVSLYEALWKEGRRVFNHGKMQAITYVDDIVEGVLRTWIAPRSPIQNGAVDNRPGGSSAPIVYPTRQ